jgi:hypothetical protein
MLDKKESNAVCNLLEKIVDKEKSLSEISSKNIKVHQTSFSALNGLYSDLKTLLPNNMTQEAIDVLIYVYRISNTKEAIIRKYKSLDNDNESER